MRAVLGSSAGRRVEPSKGAAVGAAERRRFGYMPEERGLYPGMIVREQIEYFARLHGLTAADAQRAAATWLQRVGIAERADGKIEALSLGNQQRVQLAAALVHDPELLILDEPMSGLDPAGVDAIGEILAERAATGRGVLFSSHQLDLVEHLCESVAIIDRGRLVVEGRVDDLARGGGRRLVVRVEGDRDGTWARSLPGVSVTEIAGGEVRLLLDEGVDSQGVLEAAMNAGAGQPVRLRAPASVGGVPGSGPMRYGIIAAVVLFAAFRVWRRVRRGGSPTAFPAGRALSALSGRGGQAGLVASREVRERFRSRVFRFGTVLVVLVVAAAVVIPVLRKGRQSHTQVRRGRDPLRASAGTRSWPRVPPPGPSSSWSQCRASPRPRPTCGPAPSRWPSTGRSASS